MFGNDDKKNQKSLKKDLTFKTNHVY